MTAPPALAPHPAPPRPRPRAPLTARRAGGAIRVGRLAGIPVGVQPLWFVIVGLITWSLGAEYFPARAPGLGEMAAYGLGLAGALLLFAGIVAHELGHAVVARRHGVAIEEIDLWLLGGVARMAGEPAEPRAELRFAIAGPLVTLALVAAFAGLRLLIGDGGADWLVALVEYELFINLAILSLNLLPAFPLDGGRVLRALLWRRSGDQMGATTTAATVGRAFGWSFVALGVVAAGGGAATGLWMVLVGGFLVLAGKAEADHLRVHRALAGRRAADLMSSPAIVVMVGTTVEEAIDLCFSRHLHRGYPVVDTAGRAVGLLTLREIRSVAPALRSLVRVETVVDRDPGLIAAPGDELASIFSRPAFQRAGRVVVVDADGRPAGVLSRTDVERLLQALELVQQPVSEVHHG